ncbi:OmpA family protein [Hymenobacter negativus]|uniref:OmpA family protein n=1 Tax=Hymenobacter negativus TaxID=2795026 RepID=A0ABS3QGF0_9BACT|nr:OmpA family protein [Hymenobacter negativus]MBO2010306.1 OmpA family protein [Hymenobacter negativus]
MAFPVRSLLLTSLFAGVLQLAHGQNVPFDAAHIPNKELLKIAQKALRNGEEEYTAAPPRYAAALPLFLEAQKINPNNGALNMRVGDCYLNAGDVPTALPFLQKAAELETGSRAPRAHYVLGRAYQLSSRWAEALKEFERAKPIAAAAVTAKKGQAPADAAAAEVGRRLAECRVGQQLTQRPVRMFVDNLGPTVNSPEDDHSPQVLADESMLILTSRRAGAMGGTKASTGRGFADDIYMATGSGAAWGPARVLNAPVNTNGADVAVAVSVDGQRMLLHADGNDGDLSETRLSATGWSKPHPLGSHINTKYRETSATFSPDGRYVFFVSDKPEGSLGGKDIYKAEIDGKTPAVNLGAAINTPFDEEGVFMQPDGKTLIFSSQGHSTMGGFDLFRSVYENGKWSTPENLGSPINSPNDDMSLVTMASGRYGYFASDRPGGLGGQDLYRITFLGAEKQVVINHEDRLLASRPRVVRQARATLAVPVITPAVTLLKGTVTDIANQQPVPARLEVIDNANGQVLGSFLTTPNGKYLLSFPSGTNYGLVVSTEGYLPHSENVNLPPATGYAENKRDIRLQKPEPGSNIVLNNVFFDPGKANLRPESTAELDRLVRLLADSPKLKLHLAGHTDNSGEPAANQDLSQRRVQAIMTYLIEHKVKPDRLTATGYGGTVPLASNTTEAGRQLNRRTEFKVVSR